jgi:hypothetical protein
MLSLSKHEDSPDGNISCVANALVKYPRPRDDACGLEASTVTV